MNERLLTAAGALLALLLVIGLLVRTPVTQSQPESRASSQDRGRNGYHALSRWLQQSGIPALPLRERYERLAALSPQPTGNLLIVTEPAVHPLRQAEGRWLRRWVSRGNDVLVLRADPYQAAPGGVIGTLGLAAWPADDGPDAECEGQQPVPESEPGSRLRPNAADVEDPLLLGVRELQVPPEPAASPTPAKPRAYYAVDYAEGEDRLTFLWLCDLRSGQPGLWQFRLNRGRIWVAAHAALFANAGLGEADNAQFFANLVGRSVADGGAVIFDDMHQGDSALYDPAAFYRDPRVHASLGLLLLLWLLYLTGYSNRFVKPAAAEAAVTPASFAETVGGFLSLRLRPADAAEALLQRFHADVRRRCGQDPTHEPAWDLLSQAPRVEQASVHALRSEQARIAAGRQRDLRPLIHLIHQIRKQLQ